MLQESNHKTMIYYKLPITARQSLTPTRICELSAAWEQVGTTSTSSQTSPWGSYGDAVERVPTSHRKLGDAPSRHQAPVLRLSIVNSGLGTSLFLRPRKPLIIKGDPGKSC